MVAFGRANLLDFQYHEGEWEESLAVAEEFIAAAEAGRPRYQESSVLTYRALIRLARAQEQDALTDARSALARARVVGDPQILYTQLANTAHIEAVLGNRGAAERLVEELDRDRLTSDLVLALGQPVLDLIELVGVPSDLPALGTGADEHPFSQGRARLRRGRPRSVRPRSTPRSAPSWTRPSYGSGQPSSSSARAGVPRRRSNSIAPLPSTARSGRRVTSARAKRCSRQAPSDVRNEKRPPWGGRFSVNCS